MTRALRVTAVSSTIMLLLFVLTDPAKLPTIVLILPFILLFLASSSLLIYMLRRLGLSRRRGFQAGVVGGGFLVLLLVLQSLGQLTVRDILAVCFLFGVAYFYIAKFGFGRAVS